MAAGKDAAFLPTARLRLLIRRRSAYQRLHDVTPPTSKAKIINKVTPSLLLSYLMLYISHAVVNPNYILQPLALIQRKHKATKPKEMHTNKIKHILI